MEPPIKPGETWKITVVGKPVQQGDLTAMPIMKRGTREPVIGKNGRPIINQTHSNAEALKPWRQEIRAAAVDGGWPALGLAALDEPLAVRVLFYFNRPGAHFGSGKNAEILKASSGLYPDSTGADIDKLARAVLDALTDHVWKDDRRIVSLVARRRFGAPRMELSVRRFRVQTIGELRQLRGEFPDLAEDLADQLRLDLSAV